LAAQYNGDIPQTVEELCKLPGVGQKMAVLTVNIGWKKSVGIGKCHEIF
jgi:endonuclease-3